MSRSNNLRLCEGPLDEHGHCEWHQYGIYRGPKKVCAVPNDIFGRREHKRRTRFPDYGPKKWYNPPPSDVQQIWSKQARAKQNQEQRRNPEDPVITPRKRLINLWNWY